MADLLDYQFSNASKKALEIAQSIAGDNSHKQFTTSHLIRALLHKDFDVFSTLLELEKDVYYIEEWTEVRIETLKRYGQLSEKPVASDDTLITIGEADNIRIKLGEELIEPMSLFVSAITPGVAFSYEQLKSFPILPTELINHKIANNEMTSALQGGKQSSASKAKKTDSSNLLKYCTDLNDKAHQNGLEPVVSRDTEIRQIQEILGRRFKPNVLVIGDIGVGKTALVHGFVQKIIQEKTQSDTEEMKVFELDYGSFIAGATYKGEIEDRLKNIIKEIKQFDKGVLFIDEINQYIGKESNISGASSVIVSELSKGELTLIGTSSIENYTKIIERDDSFNRKFEVIKLEEPNNNEAFEMLKAAMPGYEKHHGIKIDNEILQESIKLAHRYLKEKHLPDASIDLLDRTLAAVKYNYKALQTDLPLIQEEFEKTFKTDNQTEEQQEEPRRFADRIKEKIGQIIIAQAGDLKIEPAMDEATIVSTIEEWLKKLEEIRSKEQQQLLLSDLMGLISEKTGIPIGKVQTEEREKLQKMEDSLKKRVVGQDHAIKIISDSVLESRSGLSKPGQPIGSFFFLGPTGTGKTELAKTLAEFMFQDESALIRFDMSEFKEEHSAALLYGAPPGYVGYEEGGLLVNKIRQKPYAIVLFDEIEKAHASVFDIFLQILDEGKLHDRLGKEGDFSNAVILFTSNIGSSHITESFANDIIPKSSDLLEIMSSHFRPEFLGRLTEIVPFAPISKDNVVKIFEIQLKHLLKLLTAQNISLEITDPAKEFLATKGFTPKYGARPIASTIRSDLKRPFSRLIIAGKAKSGSTISVDIENEEINIEVIN